MNDYQSVYDKLINELKDLEKKLDDAENKYNEKASNYQDIKLEKGKLEKELNVLFEEKNEMIANGDLLVSIIIGILSVLTFIFLVGLNGFLTLELGIYLKEIFLLTAKSASFVSAIAMFFGIIAIGCIEISLFKKLDKYLSKKIYNYIVSSDRCKEVLGRISIIKNELDKVKEDELVSQTQLSASKAKYENLLSDVSMKMSLKNYVEGLMNSEKQNVQEKTYARRRIINNKNNGNIE